MGRCWGRWLAGLALTARVASAQPSNPAEALPGEPAASSPNQTSVAVAPAAVVAPPQVRQWYGAPILIGDGIAYSMVAIAAVAQEDAVSVPTLWLAPATYVLTGPITHAARGNWGRAGLSLLTRGALPFLGFAVGSNYCTGVDDGTAAGGHDCVTGAFVGVALGCLSATALDAGLLATDNRAARRATVEPLLSFSAQHAFVGAAGSF